MATEQGHLRYGRARTTAVRSPQSLAGGLVLIALSALALVLTRDLSQGTLTSVGSGMFPRWLAIGVGVCGLCLVAVAFARARAGEALERWNLRAVGVVALAIVVFALTIRSFPLGAVSTPQLGLVFAGPLTILISGYASPEARGVELLLLACGLTAICMLLFGDLLNLQIPLYPASLPSLFPADWSPKAILRTLAAALLLVALALAPLARSLAGKRRLAEEGR